MCLKFFFEDKSGQKYLLSKNDSTSLLFSSYMYILVRVDIFLSMPASFSESMVNSVPFTGAADKTCDRM